MRLLCRLSLQCLVLTACVTVTVRSTRIALFMYVLALNVYSNVKGDQIPGLGALLQHAPPNTRSFNNLRRFDVLRRSGSTTSSSLPYITVSLHYCAEVKFPNKPFTAFNYFSGAEAAISRVREWKNANCCHLFTTSPSSVVG